MMYRSEKIFGIPLILGVGFYLLMMHTSASQMSIRIKRMHVNGTNIEVHVQTQCNGVNRWFNSEKSNFVLVLDDGKLMNSKEVVFSIMTDHKMPLTKTISANNITAR